MYLSHRKQFFFIHIHRTGGTSIEAFFYNRLKMVKPLGFSQHENIHTLSDLLLSAYSNYYSFAFVRNPWERMFSWYSQLYRYQEVGVNSAGFKEFVLACIQEEKSNRFFRLNQLDYLTNQSGELIVKEIGRFENFEVDATRIFKRIGFDGCPEWHNKGAGLDYRAYYDEEIKGLIANKCAGDIRRFGYTF